MPRDAEDSQAGARRGATRCRRLLAARSDDYRVGALRRRRRVPPEDAARGRGGGATEHRVLVSYLSLLLHSSAVAFAYWLEHEAARAASAPAAAV